MVNEIKGNIVVKTIKEELSSVSTGNKTELKIRFTGSIRDKDDVFSAEVESFVIKGDPAEVRQLMKLLNLDTIDETTNLSIDKNVQTRLDEEED